MQRPSSNATSRDTLVFKQAAAGASAAMVSSSDHEAGARVTALMVARVTTSEEPSAEMLAMARREVV